MDRRKLNELTDATQQNEDLSTKLDHLATTYCLDEQQVTAKTSS